MVCAVFEYRCLQQGLVGNFLILKRISSGVIIGDRLPYGQWIVISAMQFTVKLEFKYF